MGDQGYQPPTYDVTEDYYSYLGISPHATKSEIKKAYWQKSRQCHPDKGPPEEKKERTEQFQKLANVWEILSTDIVRASYDAEREWYLNSNSSSSSSSSSSLSLIHI